MTSARKVSARQLGAGHPRRHASSLEHAVEPARVTDRADVHGPSDSDSSPSPPPSDPSNHSPAWPRRPVGCTEPRLSACRRPAYSIASLSAAYVQDQPDSPAPAGRPGCGGRYRRPGSGSPASARSMRSRLSVAGRLRFGPGGRTVERDELRGRSRRRRPRPGFAGGGGRVARARRRARQDRPAEVGSRVDEGVARRRGGIPARWTSGRSLPDSCVDAGNLHPRPDPGSGGHGGRPATTLPSLGRGVPRHDARRWRDQQSRTSQDRSGVEDVARRERGFRRRPHISVTAQLPVGDSGCQRGRSSERFASIRHGFGVAAAPTPGRPRHPQTTTRRRDADLRGLQGVRGLGTSSRCDFSGAEPGPQLDCPASGLRQDTRLP